MREPIDKSPGSRVYCAKIKPSQNRSTNLPAICYHSRSYILRNSKSYCTSRIPFSFSRRSLSNLTRGIRVLLSSERPKRESGDPMLDNPRDFLGIPLSLPSHCLLPQRRFFVLVIVRVIRRAAAPIISAAERALRGSTIEIACRLSAWPPQPFPPPAFLAISSFHRALFHRRRQTIQTPPDVDRAATTTKSSAKLLSAWRTGHRAPSSCPRSRGDYCTIGERWRGQRRRRRRCRFLLERDRDSVGICLPFLPSLVLPIYGILSFQVSLLYLRFLSLLHTLGYVCKYVRVKARI